MKTDFQRNYYLEFLHKLSDRSKSKQEEMAIHCSTAQNIKNLTEIITACAGYKIFLDSAFHVFNKLTESFVYDQRFGPNILKFNVWDTVFLCHININSYLLAFYQRNELDYVWKLGKNVILILQIKYMSQFRWFKVLFSVFVLFLTICSLWKMPIFTTCCTFHAW